MQPPTTSSIVTNLDELRAKMRQETEDFLAQSASSTADLRAEYRALLRELGAMREMRSSTKLDVSTGRSQSPCPAAA